MTMNDDYLQDRILSYEQTAHQLADQLHILGSKVEQQALNISAPGQYHAAARRALDEFLQGVGNQATVLCRLVGNATEVDMRVVGGRAIETLLDGIEGT